VASGRCFATQVRRFGKFVTPYELGFLRLFRFLATRVNMAQPIENHAIVGNLRTAALIGLDGAVNFLCWPRFDSPSIFASLLDDERGGFFELTPVLEGPRHRQLYLPDTNVLLTRFLSFDGVAEISDFMTLRDLDGGSRLVRRVKAVRGSIRFRMRCMPRFDYARLDPEVYAEAGTVIFTGGDNLALRLRASVPVDVSKGAALSEFDGCRGVGLLHPGGCITRRGLHLRRSRVCERRV
jgi:GH15 family glucan-1,4-alpha-glucosidase